MQFDSGAIISACFFYAFAGAIAGTVAQFVVRGRIGCLLGNLFIGLAGAIIARFVLDLLNAAVPTIMRVLPDKTGFLGTTILASITATLISLIFSQALKAERQHQQRLLDRYPKGQNPH